MEKMTFVQAMKHFFGLREGQTLKGFMEEIKTLDDNDRDYFKRGLKTAGYEII